MEKHTFKITLTAAGVGSKIEMDGRPLSVRSITIKAGLDGVTTVSVEMPRCEVEINGEAYIDTTTLLHNVRRLECPSTSEPS